MFASQLLRILQTIPSDVKTQTCIYDTVENDTNMKENQNAILYHSESLGRKADPLAFGSKEIYQFNGLGDDGTHPSVFEMKSNDESWNPKFDDFSMSSQNGTGDSMVKEFQDGLMYCPSSSKEDSEDVLSSYTNVKVQSNPEHECSLSVVESMHYEDESKSQNFSATDLFETDTNPYSDKNVFESDPPEVMVCYKEINYHIVKDICVDEGMNVNSQVSVKGSCAVDFDFFISGGLAASPLENTREVSDAKHGIEDERDGKLLDPVRSKLPFESSTDRHAFKHCDPGDSMQKDEAVDLELLVSDGLGNSSLDHTRDVSDDENGNKDKRDGKLVDPVRTKSSSESSSDRNCDSGDLSVQKGETKVGAIGRTVKVHASEEVSFVDRTLPIQEFGTRSFLRSFLNSLDREENKVAKFPDQNASEEIVFEGPTASPVEAGPKDDIQAGSLVYNSKVENGTITFNFNSLSPTINGVDAKNGNIQNALDSMSILIHKDVDADDHSDARQVHHNSSSSKDSNSEKAHEQSLNIENDISNELPTINDENVHDQSIEHIDEKSNDLSPDGLRHQFPISKSLNCTNSDSGYGSSSVVGPRKYDEGEVSFSAAGLITYSGPIPYSGSLSDGSATSSRSFAFPVLRPELASSPDSIPKGDGGHFRKHKGWKSGLLCCRFRKDSTSY